MQIVAKQSRRSGATDVSCVAEGSRNMARRRNESARGDCDGRTARDCPSVRIDGYVRAMPVLPYSDADKARFAELAALYLACRQAFRDLTEQTQSSPYPNSYAARDAQALLARDPPIAETSERLITWLVQLYLYAASEHLGGLGALYAQHEVLIAPLVVSRSVLEHSAHAIWIIGNAKDDPQDRLARSLRLPRSPWNFGDGDPGVIVTQ